MNTLYIAIDESGTFASDEKYFIYGGYSILSEPRYLAKCRKYLAVESSLKCSGEVKASNLDEGQKNRLLAVMKNQTSFGLAITNNHLPKSCYHDNISKALVKDDLLRNLIIEVIDSYDINLIDKIVIEIDEQNLKFGLRENLYLNLYKQLVSGYYNRNQYIKPHFNESLQLHVEYVDSKNSPLVRSADILVNQSRLYLTNSNDIYSILKIFKNL